MGQAYEMDFENEKLLKLIYPDGVPGMHCFAKVRLIESTKLIVKSIYLTQITFKQIRIYCRKF